MPEFSNYLENLDPVVGALSGDEILGASKDGDAVSLTTQQIANLAGAGLTREFDRAFSAELLFDKNEIEYQIHTLTADLNFTVAASGHIANQFSTVIHTIITDGTRTVTFGPGIVPLGDFQSGSVPAEGTYYVIFTYWNGNTLANWTHPSLEEATLTPLAVIAGFGAVAISDTEINLTWTNNADAESYEIEYSTTGGGGPYSPLSTPAAGASSYSATGLTANTLYHFRIRGIGDGIEFSNSQWAVSAATTQDVGDAIAPIPTFDPVDTATAFPVNKPIVITWDEGIQNTDTTEITNANVATLITLKETNAAGANIAFTATIDATKTIITITPTTIYGVTQLVYLAVAAVEDVNTNQTSGHTITFTTGDMTFFNGTSNLMLSGNILNTLFSTADTNFWLEITLGDPSMVGIQRIIAKSDNSSDATGKTFSLYVSGTNVLFHYYLNPTFSGFTARRLIKWENVLTAGQHTYVLKYDGSIDTNDGLDRAILEIDTVVQGSKTLFETEGTLDDDLISNATQVAVGNHVNSGGAPITSQWFDGLAKDFIIRSNAGATVEVNIATLALGVDSSGNGRDGTWV